MPIFQPGVYKFIGSNADGDSGGAFSTLTAGAENASIGFDNLTVVTTGSNNVAVGGYNFQELTTGSANIAIGTSNSFGFVSSSYIVAIGSGNFTNFATSDINVLIGRDCQADGTQGIAIGYGAVNAGEFVQSQIAIGTNATCDPISNRGIAIGDNSLSDGISAVSIGSASNAVGQESVSFGYLATSEAEGAVAIGSQSHAVSLGSIAIGLQAEALTLHDICIGYAAGSSIATGSNNILLGAIVGNAAQTNTIVVGNAAAATVDNQIVIGDATQTSIMLGGKDFTNLPYVATNEEVASYQAALTDDVNVIVEMNAAGANNFTIPADATTDFRIGTVLNVQQTGAGQTTIVAAGGVTINTASTLTLRAQWSIASIRKRAANTWVAYGDLTP